MAKKYDHLSREDLIALHQKRDASRKLGLVWERDEIEHESALNDDFVALDLDEALSVGEGPHRNMIIESDNFDALRYLNIAYKGRVKCIYIDPPYNTGNSDFVYNDRYLDKDDRFRHSTWVEFMYRRLSLAKELLKQEGVIIVSIDGNEIFHLGLLMDQVFGSENRIGVMVWNNVTDNNPTRIATEHEYIVCYALDLNSCATPWKSSDHDVKEAMLSVEKQLTLGTSDNKKLQTLYTKWFRENKPELSPLDNYKYIDSGGIYAGSRSVHNPGKEGYRYDVIHPVTKKACKQPLMGYRFPEDTMKGLLANDRILFGDDHTKLIELKTYLCDYQSKLSSVIALDGRAGPNELKEIFGSDRKVFNNPKPSSLLHTILSYATKPGDLIVDFFAGSGTTAHAILQMNHVASENRKPPRRFILVSSTEATSADPDKNLCRDVCAERVRRVISGYQNKKGEAVGGLAGEFAYLRATRIPVERLHSTIRHDQVWTALQQLHAGVVTPYAKADLHVLDIADTDLYYVSKMSKAVLDTLSARARKKKPAVVFSWQPGLLTQRIATEHIVFEKIPEFLVDRFGGQK